jgi:hypothetical protein
MASGHVNRVNRPNTWLDRPMLHTFKKVLANSEPSTHGGKADIIQGQADIEKCPLMTQSGHRSVAIIEAEFMRADPNIKSESH